MQIEYEADPVRPQTSDAIRARLEPSFYAWLVVGLLWIVALLNYLDRLMITAMVEPIRADFHISNRQVGLFTSVFAWVYAVVSPIGGFVADRFGRRGVIVASLFFWSLATCLSGFAHSYHELLFARGLMGISEACYMPAALAMIADYHRGRTRSLATGLHMAGIYTGAALGGLGGYLAEYFGWRFGFKTFGIFGVGYGLLLALLLRDRGPQGVVAIGEIEVHDAKKDIDVAVNMSGMGGPPMSFTGDHGRAARATSRPRFLDAMAVLLASTGFRVLFLVNILVGAINWSLYGWLPTYLKNRFHLGLGASGLSATFYVQAASFIGVLGAGVWADRWSRTNPRARVLVPAIGFCIAGPWLIVAGATPILVLAIFGLLVVGLGRGSFDANHMPMLRELVDPRYSATGFGFLNLISVAAGGAMVYAGGVMEDAGVNLAYAFRGCGVAMFVAGLLLLGVALPSRNAES